MVKKTSFKRAALPVFGMLMAAILSLTGVTYAWFTSGATATVDQINIGVQEADGLQIAIGKDGDNLTWGSRYTAIDKLEGLTFSPMSGYVGESGLELYTATLDDTYDKITKFTKDNVTAQTKDSEEKEGNYISLDLYFRNVSTTARLIDISGTKVEATAGGNSHQAVRMAFIKKASVTGSASNYTETSITGFLSGDEAGDIKIYEPNATAHSVTGIADYTKYGQTAKNGKYTYRAIAGEGVENAYYNRYTGDYFVKNAARTEGTYTKPGVGTDAGITGGNLGDAAGDYYLNPAKAENGETFVIWDADADYKQIDAETALSQIAQRAVYTKATNGYELVTNGSAITTNGTYYVCNPVETFEMAVNTDESSVLKTVTTYGESEKYFTLAANSVTKVTVVIWLEGQDADCDNATAGRPFSVSLQFNSSSAPQSSEG